MSRAGIACGIVYLCISSLASQAADRTSLPIGAVADQTVKIATTIPDFSGVWSRAWVERQLFELPDSGRGPVTGDPAWPHTRGVNAPWIADLNSPILRPQTRAKLQVLADQQKADHALQDNDTLCLPLGVLAALNLFDAMQILQTPAQVTFLYARDHQVRTVYLNRPHVRITPTWYGDSVGHYEGNTLVIDTIGMNDKTLVDRYGTPHSEALHTVERYRVSADGGKLLVTVAVEDPAIFTTPWMAKADYHREPPPSFEEIVCAENNRPAGESGVQIPTALRPDF